MESLSSVQLQELGIPLSAFFVCYTQAPIISNNMNIRVYEIGIFILLAVPTIYAMIGAPFVPTHMVQVKRMLDSSRLKKGMRVYDLGCGDARVLVSAVKDFGVKKAIGYEVALWPYLIAKWKIYKSNLDDRIEINKKSFFESDLSGAGFVYAYLFPKLVPAPAHGRGRRRIFRIG